jgi:hypothetical protein
MAVTAGSKLKLLQGEIETKNYSYIVKPVQPGHFFALQVEIQASDKPGYYLLELQTTFENYTFGEKVTLEIIVEDDQSQHEVVSSFLS